MSKKRALIIGGSLGGLIAAHLLRSVGWDAVVFERNADDLIGRGAGIGTHQHLIDILRRVGIAFDDSMGVRVSRVLCLDRTGAIVLAKDTVRVMSGWARLYGSLRGALPAECYRLGHALARAEPDADGVTAVFADGARERGDLLIGADGIRSTVRAQFLPDAQPVYAGYVAWRAMIEERDIPERIRAEVCERATRVLRPRGRAMPRLSGAGPRQRHLRPAAAPTNIVWYRSDRCVDRGAGRSLHRRVRPPRHGDGGGSRRRWIRPDVIAAIKATARALIAPQIAEIFARSEPFFQPDLRSRVVRDRVLASRCRASRCSATPPSWRRPACRRRRHQGCARRAARR